MKPEWFATDSIPYPKMWPDDYMWFPYMFKDQPFYGYFIFRGMDVILDHRLETVNRIDTVQIPQEPLLKLC